MRNPIKTIDWKVLKGPGRPRAAPSGLVPLRPLPVPTVDEKNHPEALALAPFCQGKGIGDIKQSWFAISPKGAGYDCQRHYEILGQAVLCIFMDEGAPPLLRKCFRDGHNCLTFSNAEELRRKMDQCADPGRLIEQAREDLLSTHLASRRAEELVSVMVSKTLASGKPGWLNRLEWCSWVARATARHGHFRPHP